MPVSTPSAAVIRSDLGGFLENLNAASFGFIAQALFPSALTPMRTGRFRVMNAGEFLRYVETKRAPMGASARLPAARTYIDFDIDEFAAEGQIDDSDQQPFGSPEQGDQNTSLRIAGGILRTLEVDTSAAVFNETTFPASGATGLTVGTPWSTAASATPINDVMTGHQSITDRTGQKANTLVITRKAWRNLSVCASVLERIKYAANPVTAEGYIKAPELARIFDVDEVLIAGSVKNTANMGLADSLSNIWSDTYAFLAYKGKGDPTMEPQIGRCMTWDQTPPTPGADSKFSTNVDGESVLVEEYAEPRSSSRILKVKMFKQPKIITNECGYLLKGVG